MTVAAILKIERGCLVICVDTGVSFRNEGLDKSGWGSDDYLGVAYGVTVETV